MYICINKFSASTSDHKPLHLLRIQQEVAYVYTSYITLQCFTKKVSSASRSVREGLFACNVVTNFKLRARMGCVIIYYVTHIQMANLLHKSPVCESVREPVLEPFHAPRVNS